MASGWTQNFVLITTFRDLPRQFLTFAGFWDGNGGCEETENPVFPYLSMLSEGTLNCKKMCHLINFYISLVLWNHKCMISGTYGQVILSKWACVYPCLTWDPLLLHKEMNKHCICHQLGYVYKCLKMTWGTFKKWPTLYTHVTLWLIYSSRCQFSHFHYILQQA